MRTYAFWIWPRYGQPYKLSVVAMSSGDAINMLPACRTWDFSQGDKA
jgi:hypothetical protein